jgi:hypothetical protein
VCGVQGADLVAMLQLTDEDTLLKQELTYVRYHTMSVISQGGVR